MTPINNKISSPDNYPKAEPIRSKVATKSDSASATQTEVYSPNWNDGKDPQILNLRRVAHESGRLPTFGGSGGKGDPTGMPKDWRHSVDASGNSIYRNGFVDESAYRPKVTVRKKKRNVPPQQRTEARPEVVKKESSAPKAPPRNGLWRPEAISKYRVVPKKPEVAEAKPSAEPAQNRPKASSHQPLPKGAGKFHEAQANSNAMHQLADRAVDKKGAFSAEALLLRTGAVFYDLSGAVPAQKTGTVWGDPNGSAKDRALATGELGLAATQYLPVGKFVGDGLRSVKNGRALLQPGKIGVGKLKNSKPTKGATNGRQVETGGLRGEKPLSEAQKVEMKALAEELGMPGDQIRFTDTGNTAYVDDWDTLFVGTDVMPSANPGGVGTLQANQRLGWKAAMNHELVGHRAAGLAGKAHPPGSALDEAQASIRAARYGKDLTRKDRIQLLRDAISRLHKDGIKVRDVKKLLWIEEAK